MVWIEPKIIILVPTPFEKSPLDLLLGFSFITLGSSMEGYSLYKRNAFEILEDDMSFSVEEAEKDCILMYLPLDCEEL